MYLDKFFKEYSQQTKSHKFICIKNKEKALASPIGLVRGDEGG